MYKRRKFLLLLLLLLLMMMMMMMTLFPLARNAGEQWQLALGFLDKLREINADPEVLSEWRIRIAMSAPSEYDPFLGR